MFSLYQSALKLLTEGRHPWLFADMFGVKTNGGAINNASEWYVDVCWLRMRAMLALHSWISSHGIACQRHRSNMGYIAALAWRLPLVMWVALPNAPSHCLSWPLPAWARVANQLQRGAVSILSNGGFRGLRSLSEFMSALEEHLLSFDPCRELTPEACRTLDGLQERDQLARPMEVKRW